MVGVVFVIIKFLEQKYIDKQKGPQPLKHLVRDVGLVALSTGVGSFLFFNYNKEIGEFFNTVTDAKVIVDGPAQVFTDSPGF